MGDIIRKVITTDTLDQFKRDYDQKLNWLLESKQSKDYASDNDIENMFGCQVTFEYSNATGPGNTWVSEDSSYAAAFYPIENYTIDNIRVTMNGTDISDRVVDYANSEVFIPEVTGDLYIQVAASPSGTWWGINYNMDTSAISIDNYTTQVPNGGHLNVTLNNYNGELNDVYITYNGEYYYPGSGYVIQNSPSSYTIDLDVYSEVYIYATAVSYHTHGIYYNLSSNCYHDGPERVVEGGSFSAQVYCGSEFELYDVRVESNGNVYYPDDGSGVISTQSYYSVYVNMGNIYSDVYVYASDREHSYSTNYNIDYSRVDSGVNIGCLDGSSLPYELPKGSTLQIYLSTKGSTLTDVKVYGDPGTGSDEYGLGSGYVTKESDNYYTISFPVYSDVEVMCHVK